MYCDYISVLLSMYVYYVLILYYTVLNPQHTLLLFYTGFNLTRGKQYYLLLYSLMYSDLLINVLNFLLINL